MFPLQQKIFLFIQTQSGKENNIKSNNQKKKHQNIKEHKINLFMYKAKKKKNYCPLLKIFNHGELKGGLNNRNELFNHDLAALFLKLNTCLQFYNHPLQLEEVEGAQAECQLYN